MVILGVDPGVRVAGYAVIRVERRKWSVLSCGALSLSSYYVLSRRLGYFYMCISQIMSQFYVDRISIETPFLGKNAHNFLKLGYVRGVLFLLADQYAASVREYTPRQIKQAVTGFGGAHKEQVARMVFRLCPEVQDVSSRDVTDALAAALCCAFARD